MEAHLTQLKTYLTTFPEGEVKDHVLQSIQELDLNMKVARYTFYQPQDRLVLVVHYLLVEKKFKTKPISSTVPVNWDHTAAQRIYEFTYTHDDLAQDELVVKMLVLKDSLQLHVARQSNPSSIFSLQLQLAEYFNHETEKCSKIQQLRDLLQAQIFDSVFPSKSRGKNSSTISSIQSLQHGERPNTDIQYPDVGRGDAVPPFVGGFAHPGSEVGPDHPIFSGGHPVPSIPQGPVPGARFDPFGPLGPTGPRPFRPSRPAAPSFPFQDPNPDHMRMPPDSNDPPFGSGNMFF